MTYAPEMSHALGEKSASSFEPACTTRIYAHTSQMAQGTTIHGADLPHEHTHTLLYSQSLNIHQRSNSFTIYLRMYLYYSLSGRSRQMMKTKWYRPYP